MKSALIVATILTASCSALDPNIGPWRTEPPAVDDAGLSIDGGSDDADDTPGTVSFARDIRPLFMRTRDEAMRLGKPRGCVPCHDRKAPNPTGFALSGFEISTLGSIRLGGGSSGTRIIVPGKPAESVLVKVLRGSYGFSARMPKGDQWTEEDIGLVETWILEGAKGAPGE